MKRHSHNRKEIRLIGLYPKKGHKYLYAYAYDGRLTPEGRKHYVSLCTQETDSAKARAKAEQFVNKLKQNGSD